ncbi:hypothetical protein A7982_12816 [Minicystis rosea]|nr:hypothetical protein A7982_12816 [Minicystis rosea]
MQPWIPEEPAVPSQQRATGRFTLRYEDISQDGRLLVEALPTALGEIWRRLDDAQRASFGSERGVLPILSRVIVENGEGPISVGGPTTTEGLYQLAHTVDAAGAVDRLILAMWSRVSSVIGRTNGAPPADAGRPVVAGRVFAEHVFTRPFGPPDRRKVVALQVGGQSVVPPDPWAYRDPESTLTLPEGAVPLDENLVPDSTFTVFGLDHTDSNQHTNSLVYPRLFIEAALRRLDAHGRARPPLLARRIELSYRKPSFAGERVRVHTRAFTAGDAVGAAAVLWSDEEAARPAGSVRPRVYARILFGT